MRNCQWFHLYLLLLLVAINAHAQNETTQPRFIPPPPARELVVPPVDELSSYDELPLSIRQQVPRPEIQLHSYHKDADKRYALINGFRGREGLPIGQELWVHQITPEGVILRIQDEFIFLRP